MGQGQQINITAGGEYYQ